MATSMDSSEKQSTEILVSPTKSALGRSAGNTMQQNIVVFFSLLILTEIMSHA